MSTAVIGARCDKCEVEMGVVLEWKGKEESIKTIQETKCDSCGSDEWHFTDTMER